MRKSIQGHWVMSGPTSTTWHTPSPGPHIYHPAGYTTRIDLHKKSQTSTFPYRESSTNHLLFICVCKCRVPIEDCGIPDISNHLAARPTYYLFASLLSFYPFVSCLLHIFIFVFFVFLLYMYILYFLPHPAVWFLFASLLSSQHSATLYGHDCEIMFMNDFIKFVMQGKT